VKILLDTCTFLWIATGSSRLSTDAAALFRDPDNHVFLSAVSAWEITVKHGLGRLPLPEPPSRFVPDLRERHGIRSLPIDEESATRLSALPDLHRDPFDRILVSQAITGGMVLLTPDRAITAYPVRSRW